MTKLQELKQKSAEADTDYQYALIVANHAENKAIEAWTAYKVLKSNNIPEENQEP